MISAVRVVAAGGARAVTARMWQKHLSGGSLHSSFDAAPQSGSRRVERGRPTWPGTAFTARSLAVELAERRRFVAPDQHLVGDGDTHIQQFLCDGGDVAVGFADHRHQQILLAGD